MIMTRGLSVGRFLSGWFAGNGKVEEKILKELLLCRTFFLSLLLTHGSCCTGQWTVVADGVPVQRYKEQTAHIQSAPPNNVRWHLLIVTVSQTERYRAYRLHHGPTLFPVVAHPLIVSKLISMADVEFQFFFNGSSALMTRFIYFLFHT